MAENPYKTLLGDEFRVEIVQGPPGLVQILTVDDGERCVQIYLNNRDRWELIKALRSDR